MMAFFKQDGTSPGRRQSLWYVMPVLLVCLFSGSCMSCGRQQENTVRDTGKSAETAENTTCEEYVSETASIWQDPIPAEKGKWYTIPEMPAEETDTEENRLIWSIGDPQESVCPLQLEGYRYADVYTGKYGTASAGWIRLQITTETETEEAFLYVPVGGGRDTSPITLVQETETVYSLYLTAFYGREFCFRYTLTDTAEGYAVSAPLETEYITLVETGAVDTELYTVSTLEEIRQYTDKGVWGEQVYRFLWNLLSGESEIPEYNTVKITDSVLTFTIPLEPYCTIWWDFTVAESGLDNLPPGKYHKVIRDIVDCYLSDPMWEARESVPYVYEETHMIVSYLAASLIWNTPAYGEGTEYPGMHNYLCEYYGNGSILLEQYIRLAKEKFGADIQPEDCPMLYEENGVVMAGGIGGNSSFSVTDTVRKPDMTHVTVQFYADCNSLLPSHKIVYHITEDGEFHGYDILEESLYPPYGLRYLTDPYTGG